jgi:beta-lactam-binding protein with PASTA domain
MKITIKSDTPTKDMTQTQSQTIKRVAAVLRANGFEVEITEYYQCDNAGPSVYGTPDKVLLKAC